MEWSGSVAHAYRFWNRWMLQFIGTRCISQCITVSNCLVYRSNDVITWFLVVYDALKGRKCEICYTEYYEHVDCHAKSTHPSHLGSKESNTILLSIRTLNLFLTFAYCIMSTLPWFSSFSVIFYAQIMPPNNINPFIYTAVKPPNKISRSPRSW